MTDMRSTARRARYESQKERRVQVAALRLAGEHNQSRIATLFGVHPSQIVRDFKVIDAEWRVQWAEQAQTWRAQDAQRIEELIKAVWTQAVKPGKEQFQAIDRVIALLNRRAKLLGLDAPTKIDIVDDVRRLATEAGLDPDEVVAEASRILSGMTL